jgi:putative ABC transport system substrate-binding protein
LVVTAALVRVLDVWPAVFVTGSDPVADGLVASVNRPGGNATGVSFFAALLGTKRLELLRQLVPKAATIAVIVNPHAPEAVRERRDVQAAADAVGQQLIVVEAGSDRDIETAFAKFAQGGVGALFICTDAFMNSRRERVAALAVRHALPASYSVREFATADGLMGYATDRVDMWRQVGAYTGQILRGAKPADLPVLQSTKFQFVINLQTARALGLEVPLHLQQLADEVIE